jgi:hypothetical protein
MADLTPEERRREQEMTLQTPPRRYGIDARLMFFVEDQLFGRPRTLSKFKARELVARTPYQAWEQAGYFATAARDDRMTVARQIYEHVTDTRIEQDNEQWHLLLLEEMIGEDGIKEGRIRFRLMPQLVAFGFYQFSFMLYNLRRSRSYRLNADIEDHAEHEYARLVAEHPEWESLPLRSSFADAYGVFGSRADVLRQIGYDERVHKQQSLDRMEAR